MLQRLTVVIVFTCLLIGAILMVGCGGGASTAGQAQGVYTGASGSHTLQVIILPNDTWYALHGDTDAYGFYIDGMMAGTGSSNSGTFTGAGADYTSTPPVSGTVNANYVTGTSIQGTVNGGGTSLPFSGTKLTGFNFATPAALSDIAGSWNGYRLNGNAASVEVSGTTGAFSGSSYGCTFTGIVTPDTAKNFFKVSLAYGAAPCEVPYLATEGVAIVYTPATGVRQFIVAGHSASAGDVFAATRAAAQ